MVELHVCLLQVNGQSMDYFESIISVFIQCIKLLVGVASVVDPLAMQHQTCR